MRGAAGPPSTTRSQVRYAARPTPTAAAPRSPAPAAGRIWGMSSRVNALPTRIRATASTPLARLRAGRGAVRPNLLRGGRHDRNGDLRRRLFLGRGIPAGTTARRPLGRSGLHRRPHRPPYLRGGVQPYHGTRRSGARDLRYVEGLLRNARTPLLRDPRPYADRPPRPDIGDQYRSEIFYTSPEQRAVAERLIALLRSKGYRVATRVTPAGPFWPAETCHQDYYRRRGTLPYCHAYTRRF